VFSGLQRSYAFFSSFFSFAGGALGGVGVGGPGGKVDLNEEQSVQTCTKILQRANHQRKNTLWGKT